MKKHKTGTLRNRSFSWKATPEYRLLGWLNRAVAARGRRMSLPSGVRMEDLCGRPVVQSPGVVYPLHAVGSSQAPHASLAIGASWLFMPLPTSMSAAALQRCKRPASGGNRTDPQPFVMAHLAGIRTGAWSRRALLRAHGWWHAAADQLVAHDLGWGRRPGVLLMQELDSTTGKLAMLPNAVRSQGSFDVLAGNLLLLALLFGRRAVIPEVACSAIGPGAAPRRGFGYRPVGSPRREGDGVACAWVPPRECWRVEYVTAREFEREREKKAASVGFPTKDFTDGAQRLRRQIESLKERVITSGFNAQLLRRVTLTTERFSAIDSAPIGTDQSVPRGRALLKSAWGGKARPGTRGTLAVCDEQGRELAMLLASAALRLPSTAGIARNASALRRRLREIACERARMVLAVLPDRMLTRAVDLNHSRRTVGSRMEYAMESADTSSPSTISLTALQSVHSPVKHDRQHLQLIRLLATVPLVRHLLPFDRIVTHISNRRNVSSIDQRRQEVDLRCIKHLLAPSV